VIALALASSITGVFFLSLSLVGWIKWDMNILTRLILFAAAFAMMIQDTSSDLLGVLLAAIGLVLHCF
jgi:TRAP-type uncharacterized transport system fused permease subunit